MRLHTVELTRPTQPASAAGGALPGASAPALARPAALPGLLAPGAARGERQLRWGLLLHGCLPEGLPAFPLWLEAGEQPLLVRRIASRHEGASRTRTRITGGMRPRMGQCALPHLRQAFPAPPRLPVRALARPAGLPAARRRGAAAGLRRARAGRLPNRAVAPLRQPKGAARGPGARTAARVQARMSA